MFGNAKQFVTEVATNAKEFTRDRLVKAESRLVERRKALISGEVGGIREGLLLVIGGVLIIVVALVLAATVDSQAATAGGAAVVGSFSGVQATNDLIPLVFRVVVIAIGVGMIGVGGAVAAGLRGGKAD